MWNVLSQIYFTAIRVTFVSVYGCLVLREIILAGEKSTTQPIQGRLVLCNYRVTATRPIKRLQLPERQVWSLLASHMLNAKIGFVLHLAPISLHRTKRLLLTPTCTLYFLTNWSPALLPVWFGTVCVLGPRREGDGRRRENQGRTKKKGSKVLEGAYICIVKKMFTTKNIFMEI